MTTYALVCLSESVILDFRSLLGKEVLFNIGIVPNGKQVHHRHFVVQLHFEAFDTFSHSKYGAEVFKARFDVINRLICDIDPRSSFRRVGIWVKKQHLNIYVLLNQELENWVIVGSISVFNP